MKLTRAHGAEHIDALSVASEFLMGALRAIAQGYPPESAEVQRSIEWAKAKIGECSAAQKAVE